MADPAFEIDLTDADGNEFQADEQYTLQHMASMGENAVGTTPDGTGVIVQDEQGSFVVPIMDFWQDQGYNVKGVKPSDPIYDHVDTGLRAKMESLPDDGMKRFYLEREMQNRGIKDAKIVGNGSDWFIAEPQTGKWIALTNKPGLDWTDAGQALNVGVSTLGGVTGAGMGTMLGGPAGTVAGGALGSVLSRGVLDSAYRYLDDSYADTQNQYAGELAKDYAKDAAISGAVGLLPAIKPLARSLGIGAKAAAGVGKVAEGAGGLAKNELAASMAAPFTPGLGTVSTYGTLASLPKRGVEAATELARKVASSPQLEKVFGQEAAQGFKQKVGNVLGDTSEEILSSLGMPNAAKLTEGLGRAGIGAENAAIKAIQGAGQGVERAGLGLQRGGSKLQSLSEGFGRLEPDLLRQSLSKAALDKTRGPGTLKKKPIQSTILTSNDSYSPTY